MPPIFQPTPCRLCRLAMNACARRRLTCHSSARSVLVRMPRSASMLSGFCAGAPGRRRGAPGGNERLGLSDDTPLELCERVD